MRAGHVSICMDGDGCAWCGVGGGTDETALSESKTWMDMGQSGRLECVRGAGRGVLFEGGWVLEASGAGWGVCADWSLVQRAGNQSTRVPECQSAREQTLTSPRVLHVQIHVQSARLDVWASQTFGAGRP